MQVLDLGILARVDCLEAGNFLSKQLLTLNQQLLTLTGTLFHAIKTQGEATPYKISNLAMIDHIRITGLAESWARTLISRALTSLRANASREHRDHRKEIAGSP